MSVSSKTMAITVGCALVGGFLLGFIPEHISLNSASGNTRDLQQQLSTVQKEEALSNFAVRSATIYVAAEKSNYSMAEDKASSFFTDLRQYTDNLPTGDLKQQLAAALGSRDQIIAGLAKADPTVTERMRALFIKMQSIQTAVLSSK